MGGVIARILPRWEARNIGFEEQFELAREVLRVTKRQTANDTERVGLGIVNFLSFRADQALDLFEPVAAFGDDLISRMAMIQLMQLHFRAYGQYDLTLQEIEGFATRFPYTDADIRGASGQVANFARKYAGEGDSERAMDMVIEEIRRTPWTLPHGALRLPMRVGDALDGSPRMAELRALMADVRKALADELSRRKTLSPEPENDPTRTAGVPDWYWQWQGVQDGETLHEARIRAMTGLTQDLDAFLATST